MTTCVKCGHANEPESAFCENCGATLHSPTVNTSSAIPQVKHVQVTGRTRAEPAERHSRTGILIGIAVALLTIVAGAYWYFATPPQASPEVFTKVLTEHFISKPEAIDDLICLNNGLPYQQEHIRVRVSSDWRYWWMVMLSEAGLYTQMPTTQRGAATIANYMLTETGKKAIRKGRLCFADGIDSIQVKEFRESDKNAQPRWAIAHFTYRYTNLAKWAKSESANYLTSNFFKKSDIFATRVIVLKGRRWVVSEDDNFNQSVVALAQKTRQLVDHSTTQNHAESSSFIDRLKKLFSGSPSIVGKWAGDQKEIEFFEDKTLVFKDHGPGPFSGDAVSGTWIQLDDGRIKIDFTFLGMKLPPAFAKPNGDTLHVSLDRNTQFEVRKVK